jgi:hypothetical protein
MDKSNEIEKNPHQSTITDAGARSIQNAQRLSRDDSSGVLKRNDVRPGFKYRPIWPLRYRKRTLWLLAFYIPVLVIPWVFTCILETRPRSKGSSNNQPGRYSQLDVSAPISIVGTIQILNTIA